MDSLEKLHADWNRINNSDITIEMLEQIVYKRGLDNVRHTLTHKEVKEDIRHNLDAFRALSTKQKIKTLFESEYVYGPERPNPQFFDYCKDLFNFLKLMDIADPTPHANFEQRFEYFFNLISPDLTQKAF